jgi:hypothetical protein
MAQAAEGVCVANRKSQVQTLVPPKKTNKQKKNKPPE